MNGEFGVLMALKTMFPFMSLVLLLAVSRFVRGKMKDGDDEKLEEVMVHLEDDYEEDYTPANRLHFFIRHYEENK